MIMAVEATRLEICFTILIFQKLNMYCNALVTKIFEDVLLEILNPQKDRTFISSVRSSYCHPDLLLIHHPTFSDHTVPQHWTFTF